MKKKWVNFWGTIPLIWPYLLVLLLILGLCAAGVFAFRHLNRSRAEERARERFALLSDQTVDRMATYRDSCDVLAANTGILSFGGEDYSDENARQLAVASIREDMESVINLTDLPVSDLAVFYPQLPAIVSLNGFYQGTQQCHERLREQSEGVLSPQVLSDMRENTAWGVYYASGRAWLVRQILEEEGAPAYLILEYPLTRLVPMALEEGIVLVESGEELLYASREGITPEQYALLRQAVQDTHQFTWDRQEYVAYRCIVSKMDLQITIGVSVDQMLQSTPSFQGILVGLGAVGLVGMVLIYLVMYRRVILPYRYLAEATGEPEGIGLRRNVLHTARSNLLSLQSQQKAAEEERQLLIPLGVGDLLQQVRVSLPGKSGEISSRCLSLAGIRPGQRYMVTAVFSMDGLRENGYPEEPLRESFSPGKVQELLEEQLLSSRVGVAAAVENYYMVIATCTEEDTPESLEGLCQQLAGYCREQLRRDVAMTSPRLGSSPEELRHLVRQTMNEVRYLCFWHNSQQEPSADGEPQGLISFLKAMRNLINRLDQQDYTGAREVFARIMEKNLPKSAEKFPITRYRIYGMMEMLFAAVSEQEAVDENALQKMDYEKRLLGIDNLEQFRQVAETIFQELIQLQQQCAPKENPESTVNRMGEIKAYIDAHYAENSLTATSLSEQFHLSGPYLSREFKKVVGCNMLEYIQRLRVEKAKQLLEECSVKETALQSGFWDTQSLVRVFKKYEGVTPGEYKKGLENR